MNIYTIGIENRFFTTHWVSFNQHIQLGNLNRNGQVVNQFAQMIFITNYVFIIKYIMYYPKEIMKRRSKTVMNMLKF